MAMVWSGDAGSDAGRRGGCASAQALAACASMAADTAASKEPSSRLETRCSLPSCDSTWPAVGRAAGSGDMQRSMRSVTSCSGSRGAGGGLGCQAGRQGACALTGEQGRHAARHLPAPPAVQLTCGHSRWCGMRRWPRCGRSPVMISHRSTAGAQGAAGRRGRREGGRGGVRARRRAVHALQARQQSASSASHPSAPPYEYMSEAGVGAAPSSSSGAIHEKVPARGTESKQKDSPSGAGCRRRARPTSASLATPLSLSSTLADLMLGVSEALRVRGREGGKGHVRQGCRQRTALASRDSRAMSCESHLVMHKAERPRHLAGHLAAARSPGKHAAPGAAAEQRQRAEQVAACGGEGGRWGRGGRGRRLEREREGQWGMPVGE